MDVRPRANEGKASRLAYWNADGVRGNNTELENLLSELSVDICILNKTHLESGRALKFANYICHRTALGGGTSILVRRGMVHYAVSVSGLEHLEATAIHLVLATRLLKFVAAYLSPSRPLIESDLTEYLRGGFPVLIAGDLNATHTDWNSRLITARGSFLSDYANRNSCWI
jgi:endonuclease/exonuclease/phosphatase family metal-dependent hydrolase